MAFLAPSLPFPLCQEYFTEYDFLATTPEHDSTSDMGNSYLTTSIDAPFSRLNELKNWLRGFITAPNFFTEEPQHTLDDLHSALHAAIKEISMKLDPELAATIHAAGENQHCIECDEDAFLASRVLDVDKLYTTGRFGIKTLHRERAIALLIIARDEVQWLTNETRRLETHCKIAQELKGCKNRESFTYYPSPRNELPDELKSLEGAGIMCRVDDKGVDSDALGEDGEIEDQAMLEAEREKENDRRDSKDVVRNVKRENLDFMEF